MSEAKHTPGPWRILPTSRPSQFLVVAGDDKMDRHNGDSFSLQFKTANARLIAAAPDMLEALKAIESAYDTEIGWQDQVARQIHAVRAAIAKATGETK